MQAVTEPEQPLQSQPAGLTEHERRARLKRMTRWATGMLIGMLGVYILTRIYHAAGAWVGYVQAFAEAAMVGALADWFAVTALFRHPLGLKIPHTAIVPRKKDRIGDSLGRFVLTNFLNHETLASKLQQQDFVGQGVDWLLEPAHRDRVAAQLTAAIPKLVGYVDDRVVQELLRENLEQQLKDVEVAPLAHRVLTTLTAEDRHQDLLNEVIRIAGLALVENKAALQERVRKESPWYIPKFVDNSLAERILERTEAMLRELKREPDHPLRQKFSETLSNFIQELEHSPVFKRQMEAAKKELLATPAVGEHLDELWLKLKARILEDTESDDSALRARLSELLHGFAQRVLADDDLHEELNAWLRGQLLDLAEGQRDSVSQLIANTVKQWDRETVIEKLEIQVGRDLQFIRINGTLVGGLVGLTLHTLEALVG